MICQDRDELGVLRGVRVVWRQGLVLATCKAGIPWRTGAS